MTLGREPAFNEDRLANVHDQLDQVEEMWRTTPTDLGGWANRATQMMALARSLHTQNEELRRQIATLHGELGRHGVGYAG